MFRRQFITSAIMLLGVTLALGFGYPLVVTGLAQLMFHNQANGSLIYSSGKLTGSALLGQNFTDSKGNPLPQYFQPRPSAAGAGYDGTSSGASNLGPSNPQFLNLVAERTTQFRHFNGLPASASVPVDAVTASGSGLDPDISVQNALDQAPRVARVRHLALTVVENLVSAHTQKSQWGFLSEPVVNVLELNLALTTIPSTTSAISATPSTSTAISTSITSTTATPTPITPTTATSPTTTATPAAEGTR